MPHSARQLLFYLTAAAIVVLALGLRLVELGKGMRLDEHSSLEVTAGADWLAKLRGYDHPPLYFVLLRAARAASEEVAFLRLLSVAAGVGMVVCAMVWLRRHGRLACLLSGLLLATHPELVHYGQEIRHYSLLLFLVVLAFTLADRAASSAEHPTLALSCVLVAALATHLIAIFVWTAILLYLGLRLAPEHRLAVRVCVLPVLLPGLVVAAGAARLLWLVGDKQTHGWMQPPNPELLALIGQLYTGEGASVWMAAVVGRSSPALAILCQGMFWTAIAILVIVVFWPRPDRGSAALLGAAFFFILQTAAVSSWLVPVLIPRSGLPFLVAVFALAALRISQMRPHWARALATSAVLLVCAVWVAWWLAVEGERPFGLWQEVARILAEGRQPADPVLFCPPYVEPPVAFYLPQLRAGRSTVVRPRLSAGDRRALLDGTLAEPAEGARRLWLVLRLTPSSLWSQNPCAALLAEVPLEREPGFELGDGISIHPFLLGTRGDENRLSR